VFKAGDTASNRPAWDNGIGSKLGGGGPGVRPGLVNSGPGFPGLPPPGPLLPLVFSGASIMINGDGRGH